MSLPSSAGDCFSTTWVMQLLSLQVLVCRSAMHWMAVCLGNKTVAVLHKRNSIYLEGIVTRGCKGQSCTAVVCSVPCTLLSVTDGHLGGSHVSASPVIGSSLAS